MSGTYAERDAVRIIPLKSDDGGATWYPIGGDASKAQPLEKPFIRAIKLQSHDAGTTWSTT